MGVPFFCIFLFLTSASYSVGDAKVAKENGSSELEQHSVEDKDCDDVEQPPLKRVT